MGGEFFVGFMMIGAGWLFSGLIGLHLGIQLERKRTTELVVEVDVEDDNTYWKKRYEQLAEEFDQEVGPKSFPQEEPDAGSKTS